MGNFFAGKGIAEHSAGSSITDLLRLHRLHDLRGRHYLHRLQPHLSLRLGSFFGLLAWQHGRST